MIPIPVDEILRGVLAFIRIGGVLFALPVFGDYPTPVRVRVLLAVAVTFAISPALPQNWISAFPTDTWEFFILVVKELFIGLAIGFVARVAFDGLLMAASIVGYQMGFGTASLMVPDAEQQLNSFTAFHRIVVIMIFLSLDLHQIFFRGMAETFTLIPGGQAVAHAGLAQVAIIATANLFKVALQLAAPILVSLMFTMAALGLVARTVPQMNVFTMSFPASFFIGLIIYIATIPFFPNWLVTHFGGSKEHIHAIITGLSP